jgi:DNA helicase-2/ATP-dependent DNA helicase PcrA
MCIGDPTQSIFGFRGSIPKSLFEFQKKYDATVIQMNKNYRSVASILGAANGVIGSMDSENHLGVLLEGVRSDNYNISTTVYSDQDEEGCEITSEIMSLHASGVNLSDIVVLYRTNSQSRGVEEFLISNSVPYVVVGGTNFYNRKEIKDLISYLRVATDSGGEDAFKRCINSPFRYLGNVFKDKVVGSRMPHENWATVVRRVADTEKLQYRQKTSVYEWSGLIDGIQRSIKIRESSTYADDRVRKHMPAALLERIIKETSYIKYLTRDEGAETVENNRVSNIRELVRSSERFTSVKEFLDYVDDTVELSQKSKNDRSSNRVTLCTLHKSKGLEWNNVFILGVNEDILPHWKAEDIEEERRLFYVGVTRTRDNLNISCVKRAAFAKGVKEMEPSRFIEESGLGGTL